MENWRKLKVGKKAHSLVIKIYKVTKDFPQNERYRLVDQICRSTHSIPGNIVLLREISTYFVCTAKRKR